MNSGRHHLIVRADILKPPDRPATAIDWLHRLIAGIGMILADVPGNPIAYYCPAPGNRGLTATALIETSNITLHTWDEARPAELQLDIFTCGALDVDTALRFVREFVPSKLVHRVLDRRDGISLDGQGGMVDA